MSTPVSPLEAEAIEHARAMVAHYAAEAARHPGNAKTAEELAAWRRRLSAAVAKGRQAAALEECN